MAKQVNQTEAIVKLLLDTTKRQIESELGELTEAISSLEDKEALSISISHKIKPLDNGRVEVDSGLSFVQRKIQVKAKFFIDPNQLNLFDPKK